MVDSCKNSNGFWVCMSSPYSQLTLPGQQAVLPPVYCSHLQSFLCFSIDSLRLQSMHILTSSHGTDRTADVVHMGLNSHGVGMADSMSVFWKRLFAVATHAGNTEMKL